MRARKAEEREETEKIQGRKWKGKHGIWDQEKKDEETEGSDLVILLSNHLILSFLYGKEKVKFTRGRNQREKNISLARRNGKGKEWRMKR